MVLVLLLVVGWGIALGVPATQRRLAHVGTTTSRRELDALRNARERSTRGPSWGSRVRDLATESAALSVDRHARQRAAARARGYLLAVALLLVAAYGAPKALWSESSGVWWLLVRLCVVVGVGVCIALLAAEWRAQAVHQSRPQPRSRTQAGKQPAGRGWSRATPGAPSMSPRPLGLRPTVRVSWSSGGGASASGIATAPRSRQAAGVAGARRPASRPGAGSVRRGHAPNPAAFR